MFKQIILFGAATSLVVPMIANAHSVARTHFLETAKPYAPYDRLMGDWYTKLADQHATIHQQFKWGPGKSYIIYSTYMVADGKPEQLHFQGMMVWNGKTKALDFLFVLQPGSGAQEKGTVTALKDGTIVREVEMTDDDGDLEHFRQTFRSVSGGKLTTSMSRQTAKGWVIDPPGDIVMEKLPTGSAT